MDDLPYDIDAASVATARDDRRLAGAAGIGGLLLISVRHEQRIAAVRFTEPSLIAVQAGTKSIFVDGHERCFTPGGVFAVNAGVTVDLVNTPDAQSRDYRALCMSFDPSLVREFWTQYGAEAAGSKLEAWAVLKLTRSLDEALQHATAGLLAAEHFAPRQLRLRMLEVLLALDAQGFRCRVSAHASAGEALRQRLSEQAQHSWTCAQAARELHMSEASLRRRLAEEGLQFRGVLDDVRMGLALGLLQGTRQPLAMVAQACGYRSVAKFGNRFKARHGLSPAELRAEAREG